MALPEFFIQFRQIRQARRNGPLRYIIPHPDDLPPPYSNYGPASAGTNDGQSRDQGNGNIATGMNSKNVPTFFKT